MLCYGTDFPRLRFLSFRFFGLLSFGNIYDMAGGSADAATKEMEALHVGQTETKVSTVLQS
jgi:hypothetical protein